MELEKKGRKPDFRAKIEVPAWVNTTRLGDQYISLQLFGTTINLFKNEPKEKVVEE